MAAAVQTSPTEYSAGANQRITLKEDINLSSENEYYRLFSATNGGSILFAGNSLSLSTKGTAPQGTTTLAAAYAQSGGSLTFGSTESPLTAATLHASSTAQSQIATALTVDGNGKTDAATSAVIHAKDLTLSAQTDSYWAYGIYALNRTTNADGPHALVQVDADRTVIDVTAPEGQSVGIICWSQSQVQINNGDVKIITRDWQNQTGTGRIINTRGDSVVQINASNNASHVIELDGDIAFEYNSVSSGTTIDSSVDINLSNSSSYLNGNIYITTNVNPIPDNKGTVTGMRLGLSNGARWTSDDASFVNTLTMNEGLLEMMGGSSEQVVDIYQLEGTGGDVRILTTISQGANGEIEIDAAKLNIKNEAPANVRAAQNTPALRVSFTGVTTDDFGSTEAALAALHELAKHVDAEENAVSATANIAEGFIIGAVQGTMDFSGKETTLQAESIKVQGPSSTLGNMRDISAVALAAWRQEDADLAERLGLLRRTQENGGLWVRLNRGEFKYSGAFKNQYNFVQLGYDVAVSDWHIGAAVSYNDGETAYHSGSGENDSISAMFYGTWHGPSGWYGDLVLKQGRLSNSFRNTADIGTTTGDYKAFGVALSAEIGKSFDVARHFFITPQARLTYARIGAEDYTAQAGGSAMRVEQDALQSIVGRLGLQAGLHAGDRVRIWGQAGIERDFDGEAESTVSMQGLKGRYQQDIGGTWTSCAFGADLRASDSTYLWADVRRTFGGDIETPWQWNIGARYIF